MDVSLLPILVFVAVYILISFELLNKAVAVLLGVMFLLILRVTDVHTAAGHIDFETIMLLLGMMAIVAVLRKSGFFAILSVRIAKLTGGSPLKILILFSIVTATISAFLFQFAFKMILMYSSACTLTNQLSAKEVQAENGQTSPVYGRNGQHV